MLWMWYLLFFSALGFVLEVAFAFVTRAPNPGRKCLLFFPLCPVYGLGGVAIALLPSWVQSRPVLYFALAALCAAGAEYLTGAFYLRCLGVRFWHYRGRTADPDGLVCLPFTLVWGLLAFPLQWVPPLARQLYTALHPAFVAGLTAAVLSDLICTTLVLELTHDPASLRWWVSQPYKSPVPRAE